MCVDTNKIVTAVSKVSAIQFVMEWDPDNLWTSLHWYVKYEQKYPYNLHTHRWFQRGQSPQYSPTQSWSLRTRGFSSPWYITRAEESFTNSKYTSSSHYHCIRTIKAAPFSLKYGGGKNLSQIWAKTGENTFYRMQWLGFKPIL